MSAATAVVGGPAAADRDPIPWTVWRLAAVIAFGAFMSQLDASVVNVGLDTVARDLDAGLGAAQWVATGYLLALGVSLPACGWLVRRFGAGRVWLWSLVAFTLSSGLCALAWDLPSLVGLRVLQGLGAGLLIPAGQTVLGQAVGPGRLGRVMSVLGIAVTMGPALGSTVGGLTLEVASWEWLFLLNVPLGLLALTFGLRLVPRGGAVAVGPLDWSGLTLLSIGLPLLVFGATSWGEQRSLTQVDVLLPLLAGAVGLAWFVARSRRSVRASTDATSDEHDRRPAPALDLRLFANRTFAAAGVTSAFTSATMFGAALVLPLYFQLGRGDDAMTTGLSLIALGVGTAIALPFTGRLVDRHGGGIVSVVGGLAAIATTLPFAVLDVDADWRVVQALLLVRGMAIALAIMPATTAAYRAVRPVQLPDATTLVNILGRIGGALGGALFTVMLAGRLADGTEAALHTTFWWLTVTSALGLAAAVWLWTSERREPPANAVPPTPGRVRPRD